jgi:hypothetical protein
MAVAHRQGDPPSIEPARLLSRRASSVKLKTEHGNRVMGELERANCGFARVLRACARVRTDASRANWQS